MLRVESPYPLSPSSPLPQLRLLPAQTDRGLTKLTKWRFKCTRPKSKTLSLACAASGERAIPNLQRGRKPCPLMDASLGRCHLRYGYNMWAADGPRPAVGRSVCPHMAGKSAGAVPSQLSPTLRDGCRIAGRPDGRTRTYKSRKWTPRLNSASYSAWRRTAANFPNSS